MTALIASYARTPFTKFTGQPHDLLADQPATALGSHAAKAAIERAGITPDQIDQVVFGQVMQAGAGENPARQTAAGAGVPKTVPAITLNAVCLSGLEAVAQAARLINAGEAEIVLAGGQESHSQVPHVINLRASAGRGDATLVDLIDLDGLQDMFYNINMVQLTEQGNKELGVSREEQDAYTVESQRRVAEFADWRNEEIAPFPGAAKDGGDLASDNSGHAGTTMEGLAKLRPLLGGEKDTITPGNTGPLANGAGALVIVSEEAAEKYGMTPIARIEATAFVAGPEDNTYLHSQPSHAISAALEKIGATPDELVAAEINEPFALVGLQSARDLGLAPEVVNPHGGALGLGHPLGATGARIIGTLARELKDAGPGSLGAAAACGGGGQGSAVLLRAL
ncbi:MAG: acetyl-CoA C-acyltransferase [Corynebacterium sp.]|uniref:acetyl-CoA C-acyltransferase n=1 Tax=unclassified Corynebacterium TaxID=2624378 RepID=UPI0026498182|nr:acetyl-CoA C-acyltransferase [Corynebacterium sp.]MDN5720026.1 acetyl-CoA C-acyltransferase [Corynebacterium sp.]MDN6324308.1 acetyl-CoA C-acyltransferase [Corynebacterium sp.]MDN6509205.1 acetyl-CoA C-acyltransferase [Corynebacterium sp.]